MLKRQMSPHSKSVIHSYVALDWIVCLLLGRQFFFTATLGNRRRQDVRPRTVLESIVSLLLTQSIGYVTHSGTTPDEVLQRRMFGHWTDIGRGSSDPCRRWLGGFQLFDGRHFPLDWVVQLEKFPFKVRDGRPFDQPHGVDHHSGRMG